MENQHLNAPGQGEKRGNNLGQTKVSVRCHSRRRKSAAFLSSSPEKFTRSQVFPWVRAAHSLTGLSVLAGRNFSVKILHYPDMTEA